MNLVSPLAPDHFLSSSLLLPLPLSSPFPFLLLFLTITIPFTIHSQPLPSSSFAPLSFLSSFSTPITSICYTLVSFFLFNYILHFTFNKIQLYDLIIKFHFQLPFTTTGEVSIDYNLNHKIINSKLSLS